MGGERGYQEVRPCCAGCPYWLPPPLSISAIVLEEVAMMQHIADRRFLPIVIGSALLVLVASGCSGSSPASVPGEPPDMVDSGSWYARERWPHDGNPYETEHFVVYSDGASQQARQRLGVLAEEVWVEVIDMMGLDPATMFKFPAGQDKVDLYANRYNVVEGGGARAYHAGVIIASFDNDIGDIHECLGGSAPT